jgi:hypothetical protein
MPTGKRALGEKLYVFSSNDGLKVHPSCIITGHGEKDGPDFPLRHGRYVSFYVNDGFRQIYHPGTRQLPDGRVVRYTTDLEAIGTSKAIVKELFGTAVPSDPVATCPDYKLTKVVGSSSERWHSGISDWLGDRNHMQYADVAGAMDYFVMMTDIVTIRNRGVLGSSIHLSEVLAALTGAYDYDHIHCSFCRSKESLFCGDPGEQPVSGALRREGGRYP